MESGDITPRSDDSSRFHSSLDMSQANPLPFTYRSSSYTTPLELRMLERTVTPTLEESFYEPTVDLDQFSRWTRTSLACPYCKPCKWFASSKGCKYGHECTSCHNEMCVQRYLLQKQQHQGMRGKLHKKTKRQRWSEGSCDTVTPAG